MVEKDESEGHGRRLGMFYMSYSIEGTRLMQGSPFLGEEQDNEKTDISDGVAVGKFLSVC